FAITVKLEAHTISDAVRILTEAANSRFEFDALDIPPGDTLAPAPKLLRKTGGSPVGVTGSLPVTAASKSSIVSGKLPETQTGEPPLLQPEHEPGVLARLAGPLSALKILSREILARWPGQILTEEDAEMVWAGLREFRW